MLSLARTRLAVALAWAAVAALLSFAALAPERADASRVAIGVYLMGAETESGVIDGYATAVGRQPAIFHVYRDWSTQPFEPQALDPIVARGSMPLVTWEPWREWSTPVSLRAIAAGAEDAYITAAARAAAAWGRPFFLRFAHEMNGGWYPWGRGQGGNTPKVYIAAWRHLVDVFRRNGATNVRWVWTPYLDGGSRPFERYYPGDRWVDWAGLDGFNWGKRFLSFSKIFGESYRELVALTSKPLMIAETGSVEYGGDKALWIRQALGRALARLPRVRALVWWSGIHETKGTDVRLDSSSTAFSAWAEGIYAPRLNGGMEFLLAKPPWLKKRR